eukprot:6664425-Pyramimonas_sp.AAC.1
METWAGEAMPPKGGSSKPKKAKPRDSVGKEKRAANAEHENAMARLRRRFRAGCLIMPRAQKCGRLTLRPHPSSHSSSSFLLLLFLSPSPSLLPLLLKRNRRRRRNSKMRTWGSVCTREGEEQQEENAGMIMAGHA